MKRFSGILAPVALLAMAAACSPTEEAAPAEEATAVEQAAPSEAEAPAEHVVEVLSATYRPPLGGGSMGVAYLTLRAAQDEQIVGASSPMAQMIELHETVVDGGQATMKSVPTLELPAGETVEFKPGGLHLMVHGPQPVEPGAVFPIELTLASGAKVTADCALMN